MFKFVVLAALFAVTTALPTRAKVPMLDGRIVGGRDANIEEFPYQISLLWFGSHICGGSIIGSRWVVTAGHCTEGGSPSQFAIRAGSSIRNSGGVVVGVQRIYEHPSYNPSTIDYDITVLNLDSDLTFGSSIGRVNLPTLNQDIIPGSNSVVTGWGALSEGGPSATQLQAVEVPVVSQAECRAAYGASSITDRMMCAGLPEGGKDACQGDSGGPLTVNGELIGIVSWGFGCARPQFPGVYSSVPALRGFITSVAGI